MGRFLVWAGSTVAMFVVTAVAIRYIAPLREVVGLRAPGQ